MQKLTRLLSARLYKVEYELYSDNRYRLIEEFPSSATSSSNRYSTHFGGNNNSGNGLGSGSGGRALSGGPIVGSSSNSNRVKVRSRHLSMQGNPRHHGGSPSTKRGASGRPISSCGSEGQLTDMKQQQEKQTLVVDNSNSTAVQEPQPEGSVSTLLRNLSSASLSDIANTFKTDRKSTNLSSVPDEVEVEDEEDGAIGGKQNLKFGIKNIIPASSFSNTPTGSIHSASNIMPSSTSIGKRSNTNNSGSSLNGNGTTNSTGEKGVGRRTISIQQLDTLWQDSGSKLLNFVHHGDTISPPQPSASKAIPAKEEDKKEWDNRSRSSSVDDNSAKVIMYKVKVYSTMEMIINSFLLKV
jgi:hypothetical protein